MFLDNSSVMWILKQSRLGSKMAANMAAMYCSLLFQETKDHDFIAKVYNLEVKDSMCGGIHSLIIWIVAQRTNVCQYDILIFMIISYSVASGIAN